MTRTDLFPMLFTRGAKLAAKNKKPQHEVMLQTIGDLHLPSGRLVTGDAIGTLDFAPLSRTVTPGIYPVEASIVTVSKDESRIAAVRINVSRQPVVTWELAKGGSLGEPGYVGPWGILIDAQILPALQTYIDGADSPDEWWYDPPKIGGKTWQVACFSPDDDRPETCMLFDTNSYNDDGPYISYWGLDANGAPAMFVTDLNLV